MDNIVFVEIQSELHRQVQLKNSGKFPWTCADVGPSHFEKLAVLAEEFGEVAKEISETIGFQQGGKYRNSRIRTELVQVAACCVAWINSLDSE